MLLHPHHPTNDGLPSTADAGDATCTVGNTLVLVFTGSGFLGRGAAGIEGEGGVDAGVETVDPAAAVVEVEVEVDVDVDDDDGTVEDVVELDDEEDGTVEDVVELDVVDVSSPPSPSSLSLSFNGMSGAVPV